MNNLDSQQRNNTLNEIKVNRNKSLNNNEYKEKSYDNYSFGYNIKNKFNIQTKVSTKENRNQKLNDNTKRREYIYNSINKTKVNDDKNKDDTKNTNINNNQNFQIRNIDMKK